VETQFIGGVVVGLVVWSLMSNKPLLRRVLAAAASAWLVEVLSGKSSPQDVGPMLERLSAGILVEPYFTFGVILATVGATLLSLVCPR